MIKSKYLDKVLKNHSPYCSIHTFSDENRHCSCGRDGAIKELEVFKESLLLIEKINEWMKNHGNLEINSFAELQIKEFIERAKNERIVGS